MVTIANHVSDCLSSFIRQQYIGLKPAAGSTGLDGSLASLREPIRINWQRLFLTREQTMV